jgi:hypothetical protein
VRKLLMVPVMLTLQLLNVVDGESQLTLHSTVYHVFTVFILLLNARMTYTDVYGHTVAVLLSKRLVIMRMHEVCANLIELLKYMLCNCVHTRCAGYLAM